MRNRGFRSLIPVLILIITWVGSLAGCTGNKNLTSIPTNSTLTSNSNLKFSETDGQILTSAYAEYDNLKNQSSPETAREQLLTKLSAQKDVVKTELGIDGYTIFITYKDGNEAAIDTYNANDYQVATTSELPGGGLSATVDLSANKLVFCSISTGLLKNEYLVNAQQSGNYISSSIKVLILAPIGPEGFEGGGSHKSLSTAPDNCIISLKAHGWTDGDITVKKNTADSPPGNLIVKPEDYFNLGSYGIILFFGHGFVRQNQNNDNLYLQFANVAKDTFDNDSQLQQWKDQKQLIINGEETSGGITWYKLYIRGDLLKQKLGKLPLSYIQLATCYGAYFHNIFDANGAGMFLSWDNVVVSNFTDSNQSNMIKLMLDGISATNAYHDSSIKKFMSLEESEWQAMPRGVNFNYYSNYTSYYIPGWFDLKITGIPSSYPYIQIVIKKSGGEFPWNWEKFSIPYQAMLEIKEADVGDKLFSPGEISVKVIPHYTKNGNETGTNSEKDFTFTLKAGENDLVINYK